jgi:hypothetical protein
VEGGSTNVRRWPFFVSLSGKRRIQSAPSCKRWVSRQIDTRLRNRMGQAEKDQDEQGVTVTRPIPRSNHAPREQSVELTACAPAWMSPIGRIMARRSTVGLAQRSTRFVRSISQRQERSGRMAFIVTLRPMRVEAAVRGLTTLIMCSAKARTRSGVTRSHGECAGWRRPCESSHASQRE